VKTYLALDIGTSSTKASLYQEDGVLLGTCSSSYEVSYPRPGWAEQNPLDWWEAVQAVCQKVLESSSQPLVRAVCVSGQAPSCVPIDRGGRPLREGILWLDRRAAPQADWLQEHLGIEQAEKISGNTLDSYYGGVKWLWYRQNEPDRYQQTWKILQASSYVSFQLTGETVVDHSQAGLCSPAYNLRQRCWDAEACEIMGIEVSKLPALHAAWEVVGRVTSQAAEATHIPAGTPVVCGGGDYACACLGAGVLRPGTAAMMLGTSGNLLVPAPRQTDLRLFNTVHVTGEGLGLGGVMAGGAVRWFVDMLRDKNPDLLTILEEEALQISPGAEGLIFLPYLMGERTPIWDPYARGVFMGLSSRHRRGHLYRAVLEGVALAYQQMAEIFAEMGSPIDDVVAINGGARSSLWRQIFADVLGIPIRWRPNSGGTALGAAFLAALGVGDQPGFESLKAWLEPTLDTFPNPEPAGVYASHYSIFKGLHGRLKDEFRRLAVEVPE
jgi:sugar (pentulose or hexulose) kinase